jgi:hypothetical protein
VSCERAADGRLVEEEGDAEHLASCADCRASRDAYRRIAAAVKGGISAHAPPPGWHARVVARALAAPAPAPPRRRRWPLAAAALVVAAAAAALLLLWPRAPGPPRLAVHVVAGDGGHRGEAAPGDTLVVTAAAPGFAWRELRVYRDGVALIAACPSEAAACSVATDGTVTARLRLERGAHQLVWLAGSAAAPPPRGALDEDLRAATAAGARLLATDTVHVR